MNFRLHLVAGELADIPLQPSRFLPGGCPGQRGGGSPVQKDHDRPERYQDLSEVGHERRQARLGVTCRR
jgi:hypothetical protein